MRRPTPAYLLTAKENSRRNEFKKCMLLGYKKVKDENGRNYILTLFVPEKAKRYRRDYATASYKSRADLAFVVKAERYFFDGKKYVTRRTRVKTFVPWHGHHERFKWRVGRWHKPEKRFASWRQGECASGLHFFLSKDAARNYY